MNWFKEYLKDFPGQSATVFMALFAVFTMSLVVTVRLALGLIFPDGYGEWMIAVVAMTGVSTAGMVGKRATDFRYKAAGTSAVNVEGPSSVSVTTEQPTPQAAPEVVAVAAATTPAQPKLPPALLTPPTEASD